MVLAGCVDKPASDTRFLTHEKYAGKCRFAAFEMELAQSPPRLRHLTNDFSDPRPACPFSKSLCSVKPGYLNLRGIKSSPNTILVALIIAHVSIRSNRQKECSNELSNRSLRSWCAAQRFQLII